MALGFSRYQECFLLLFQKLSDNLLVSGLTLGGHCLLVGNFFRLCRLSCNSRQPWITRYIKQLSRRKHRCYNQASLSNSQSEWAYYKFLKREMQKECRKANNSYMDKILL